MSDQQENCISDNEEESPVVHPNVNDDSVIRKNLFDEFDVPSKQKSSSENSDREYMKVYLRIRPFSSEEIENKENQNCVERESSTAVLANAPKESFAFKNSTRAGSEISHRFTFSNVFTEDTTQKAFFDETTLPLVTDFIHGQNCLVFTYGVTNSGKTYTIQGTPKDGGILPRSLDVLFNSIQGKQYDRMNLKPRFCSDVARLGVEAEQKEQVLKNVLLSSLNKETLDLNGLLKLEPDSFDEPADLSKAHSCVDESSLHNTFKSQESNHEDVEDDISRIADDTTINVDAQGPVRFAVWVSFAEIYNEVIYDLLEPCPMGKGKKRTTLRLGDDNNGNPYIKGLREIYVSNADEAYKILKIGQRNKKIASTKLNQCSSRSHCIFNVKVLRVVDVAEPHVARVSRISFVDLAGSERYSKTQSRGDRLKEAGNINTSLMTLGKCLEYLRHNQRNPNQPLIIPFRESKLTRLFQGFFCGRGRASMVVNVNMCASLFDETFHVLKFSAIAKKITTKVSKPVDLPLPTKKPQVPVPTPLAKLSRLSVPWANGATRTPASVIEEDEEEASGDEGYCYQQQLVNLVKVLQEKLVEEKRKMQTLEVRVREEVCKEMAEQLVAIETAYSERVRMEVTAVEEKCDRRIELLTQSIKKNRKRARIERIEEDDEEWVPSVFLHAEQVKSQEKDHIIKDLNAKIAALRQEVKQSQDTWKEEVEKSEVVLELQTKLNDANEQVSELKQMLEEAGEAFTEKEAEIHKLKAALDEEEACTKQQDIALKQLTERLEVKSASDEEEMGRLNGALEAAMLKLAETEKCLEIKDSLMKELVRALEETREELSREKSYVAQAFNNDEENITLKGQLQEAKAKNAELEKELTSKEETIKSLRGSADKERAQTEKGASKESNFDEEMAAQKSEVDRLRNEMNALSSRLEKTEKDLSEKVLESERIKTENTDLESQLRLSKEEIMQTTTEAKKTQEELSETVKELKIVKELQYAKDEVVKQECKLAEKEESEETAKGGASEKTESISQGKDCIRFETANEVEDRVKEMEAEIYHNSVELENVKTESARKINSLETELKECRLEIRKLENQEAMKELECQLEESTRALDKKNSQVITKNNVIKRLEISLAEKERMLADLENLPKEPNQRVKEELKTSRRRVMQANKEAKEAVSAKENVIRELTESQKELNDAKKSLEEVTIEVQKKEEAMQSLQKDLESQRLLNISLQTKLDCEKRELQEKENAVQESKEELIAVRRTSDSELNKMKELLDTAERKVQLLEEEVFSANEKMSQYQEEVQSYQKETVPELKSKLKVLEQKLNYSNEKVKEAEVNLERTETESRTQLEKRSKELQAKVKEVGELREALRTQDQEKCQELDKVWQELVSMQRTIEERNRTIDELEAKLRTSGREQDSRTEHIQTLAIKLKATEQQKSTLEERLEAMTQKMDLVKSDAGKEEVTSDALKQVLEDQDRVMSEQAQALDERQNEIETMLTEIESWKEKCFVTSRELEKRKVDIVDLQKHANDEKVQLKKQLEELCIQRHAKETDLNSRLRKMEEELEKLRNDKIVLDEQLRRRDAEIRKANESKDDIMKTMREALKIAEAKKAEYEVKLSTVREQCQNDMRREMDEAMRRAKRDFQRQLEEKENLLAQIKGEKESVENMDATKQGQGKSNDIPAVMINSDIELKRRENSSSSGSNKPLTSSTKKNIKRQSSDLTLAELKNQLSASKKKSKEDSDDEFTPSSQRKTKPTRSATKKAARAISCRSKLKSSAKVDVLSTMEESEPAKREEGTKKKKLFEDIKDTKNSSEESVNSNEETENVHPRAPPSSTKKRKLFSQKPTGLQDALSPIRSEGKAESVSAKTNILRQLRTRTIKY